MVHIIDYGVGNLFSLKSSFAFIGEDITVSSDPDEIAKADRIILPGVGAFSDAAKKLKESGMQDILLQKAADGVPIMGICLGMQLLFDKSYEYGEHKGLSLIKGEVVPMHGVLPSELKIPHIGWNALLLSEKKHPIFKYIKDGEHVYFVHSFYADKCEDAVIAKTEYGRLLTAAAAYKNVCGCQFHPEKSGQTGLNILRAFCEWEGN